MRHILTGFAAAALFAVPALAHPKLVSATPAADAKVAAGPRTLTLSFSEKLVAPLSGAELTMLPMPGMGPHRIPATAKLGDDGSSLVLALARPLPRGSYRVDWHVVSTDTHRVAGSYTITVG
ncbi:hypothetical protein ASE73_16770 [Sphingomonas sp. Leaf24]|uniref:copper homeostasis periplasmic binding protein CopC n=1 Tax=unclassified Sphingomonas TaxID=196159 RepID=UPI0006FF9C60|nr:MULTISPECIES: copper homeostasis periplasmic binding protein CopC [unclassified Sphingomonas]KQM20441.1 hypothetical protein ASE50_15985 [Sphingomonas sp. Leaf5]KQM92282.1 hypothetical protein ASE73_16770 [Sphingomonas sp. Leaf24]KQM93637.1 hypothetical protein ASE70_12930 [Sphingomonas sp. Leaf22]